MPDSTYNFDERDENARLGEVTAEPLTSAGRGEEESKPSPTGCPGKDSDDTLVLNPSAARQNDEPIEQPSRLSDEPGEQVVTGVDSDLMGSAETLPIDQAPKLTSDYLETEFTGAPRQTIVQIITRSSRSPENKANQSPAMNRSVARQAGEPTEPPSLSSDEPTEQVYTYVDLELIGLAEPSPVDQARTPAPVLSDTKTAAAPQQDITTKLYSGFPESRRVLVSSTKALIVAVVLAGAVAISTIATNNYFESTRLGTVNTEPVISASRGVDGPNTSSSRILGTFPEGPLDLNQSATRQIDEPLEQPSRLSGEPAEQVITGEGLYSIGSAEPLTVDQATVRVPAIPNTETAMTPKRDIIDQTVDITLPPELAAIAMSENTMAPPTPPLTLPAEKAEKAATRQPTPSSAEKQPALADSVSWRIQLASLRKQSDAEVVWTRLQQANPVLLDSLMLHVQPAELSKGKFYRVQAGPVLDRVAAVSLCNALKFRNQDCLVVAP